MVIEKIWAYPLTWPRLNLRLKMPKYLSQEFTFIFTLRKNSWDFEDRFLSNLFEGDLFVCANLDELMSMNLLIQFCAGNFFYDRAKSSRGKYYCEADDWTGSFTSVIFLWLLAEVICCFPQRSTYTTKHKKNLHSNTVRGIMHMEIISFIQVTWRVSASEKG